MLRHGPSAVRIQESRWNPWAVWSLSIQSAKFDDRHCSQPDLGCERRRWKASSGCGCGGGTADWSEPTGKRVYLLDFHWDFSCKMFSLLKILWSSICLPWPWLSSWNLFRTKQKNALTFWLFVLSHRFRFPDHPTHFSTILPSFVFIRPKNAQFQCERKRKGRKEAIFLVYQKIWSLDSVRDRFVPRNKG